MFEFILFFSRYLEFIAITSDFQSDSHYSECLEHGLCLCYENCLYWHITDNNLKV